MRKTDSRKKDSQFLRSRCAIANTLDIVGDKWSLLIIRDIFYGSNKFGSFLNSPEKIPTNILAERLKRLENAGIVRRSAYQQHPVRYEYNLTEKGKALGDVLRAIVHWGKKYIPGTATLSRNPAAHSN